MADRLYATHYSEPCVERREELTLCFAVNLDSFDAFALLPRDTRPRFSDLLEDARRDAEANDVVVVANADILIPSNTLRIINEHLRENQVYCLNRWEVSSRQGIHLWDVEYGQDAWVFRGPPKPNIGGDYWFGLPGVDNRFAHELDAAGYEVLNPSKDIRTYHIHASNKRTATNNEAHRVPPPYLYIAPHHLGETPAIKRAETFEQRKRIVAARKARV